MKLARITCLYFFSGMLALTGCRRDMFEQPKSNPLAQSDFFPDAAASRPIPSNTVPNGIQSDPVSDIGLAGTNYATLFPQPVTLEMITRGKQQYEIDCVPCHGLTGDGDGMVVQRGLPPPPSLNIDRLRAAPVGHLVNVMARGYGVMFPQAAQVSPEDRWAIAAYIRALQFSQHAELGMLPADEVSKVKATP